MSGADAPLLASAAAGLPEDPRTAARQRLVERFVYEASLAGETWAAFLPAFAKAAGEDFNYSAAGRAWQASWVQLLRELHDASPEMT